MESTPSPDLKLCRACKQEKSVAEFRKNSDGQYRCYCRTCFNLKASGYRKTRWASNPKQKEATAERQLAKHREARKSSDPNVIAKYILQDAKKIDKRKGRVTDLDLDFVTSLISQPCSYCKGSELRMTLDRIDNDVGHIRNNVVSACIRCNLARGAMPYEAWLCLVPGLQRARELGLFGDWTGRLR